MATEKTITLSDKDVPKVSALPDGCSVLLVDSAGEVLKKMSATEFANKYPKVIDLDGLGEGWWVIGRINSNTYNQNTDIMLSSGIVSVSAVTMNRKGTDFSMFSFIQGHIYGDPMEIIPLSKGCYIPKVARYQINQENYLCLYIPNGAGSGRKCAVLAAYGMTFLDKAVPLPAGTYRVSEWDMATGEMKETTSVIIGGGVICNPSKSYNLFRVPYSRGPRKRRNIIAARLHSFTA
ncbi:MAG: hypothetical protein HFJ95_01630 [Muribaculaceae bacterium]|nr:hypothetical protein [Muribaculaceae bacterium]